MASSASGRVNSTSQGFDFGSDDVLCTYDDFNGHDGGAVNGTDSNQDFHKSRMTGSSFVPTPVYNQPEESLSQEIINGVERSMKKNSDNIMRFLDGISSRLSELELYCYNIDKSVGEMHSELVRNHEEVDSKLKTLEKHIGEVHRSVKILRDKQELVDTQKELAKLQLAQKEPANSSQSKQNEERPRTPTVESQKMADPSDVHNQQLALALPHQIPHSQSSLPSRIVEPSGTVVHPSHAQPQNIPQQQHYYLPTEMQPPALPPQGQGQYGTIDSQYRQSQLQDMQQGHPQPAHSNVNQTPPPPQAHQFPQYQQQWPPQLSQQQLQPLPQLQPPNPSNIMSQPGPTYPSYQSSRPASPAPDTIPSNMGMQFSGIPQSGMSRREAAPYGYGGRPNQQQPPTQQVKDNFGAQANDVYTNTISRPGFTPASGYMMYGNEEGRPHPPPPQPHFSQGVYPPASQNPMARNPNQSQFGHNHPYNELVVKLVNMGFRGDHVLHVIQMMEDSGQTINFNAVLDRLSA